MKTTAALLLVLLASATTSAQVLRPEAVKGAVLGGLAGAVIGNNSGDLRHNAWRGAAYGAGAGLLLGGLAGEANARHATQVPVPDYPRTYVYREAPGYYGSPVYRQAVSAPYYTYGDYEVAPGYADGLARRADYRGSGLLVGALAGAIIGHNSGDLRHNGWRGAAYGAGLGYVLGSMAEHRARRREAAAPATPVTSAAVEANHGDVAPGSPEPAPAQTGRPPAPASSMSAANELFGRR